MQDDSTTREMTRIQKERVVYDKAPVDRDSGEVNIQDAVIFENAVRAPEMNILRRSIFEEKPGYLLDFGCGSGWFEKRLEGLDLHYVGVEASALLIPPASPNRTAGDFVVGDCERLPFRDSCFDFIVGIGILHHLDINAALRECRRVVALRGTCVFLEPNRLNPFTQVANRLCALPTHTPDEEPLSSQEIVEKLVENGWRVSHRFSIITFGFLASYMFRHLDPQQKNRHKMKVANLVRRIDAFFENYNFLSSFGSTVLVIAEAV